MDTFGNCQIPVCSLGVSQLGHYKLVEISAQLVIKVKTDQ